MYFKIVLLLPLILLTGDTKQDTHIDKHHIIAETIDKSRGKMTCGVSGAGMIAKCKKR